MKSIFHIMKILLVLVFMANSPLFGQGGGINSVNIVPSNPTTLDNITVIASVWLSSSGCWMDTYNTNMAGPDIDIHAYYSSGMLPAICNRTDSIGLGLLVSGTYTLKYYFHYGTTIVPTDSAIISFTVSPMVSIVQNEDEQKISIFPNPAKDVLYVSCLVSTDQDEVFLELYTSNGKRIIKSGLNTKQSIHQVDMADFPAGLYFYRISQGNTVMDTGKFCILR